jgi:dihydroneopterin aldolase
MGLIVLEGMQFHAFHGVHAEERVMGGKYQVDVYLNYPFEGNADQLDRTANYETVYRLVAQRMEVPVQLIEHLAELMLADLQQALAAAQVKVRVSKFQPPVGGVVARAYVEVGRLD